MGVVKALKAQGIRDRDKKIAGRNGREKSPHMRGHCWFVLHSINYSTMFYMKK